MWPPYDGRGPTGHEGDGAVSFTSGPGDPFLGRYVCDSTRHLQTAAAVSIRAHGVMPGGLFLCYRCHGFLKQCAHVSPVPRVDSAHVTWRGGWGIAFALVSVSGNSWARRFGGDVVARSSLIGKQHYCHVYACPFDLLIAKFVGMNEQ